MYIVGKQNGAQHGLQGQCVLVPANLRKIQGITSTLPRTWNDEAVISLFEKRLSDTSYVNKQNISPVLVNKALEKLTEINPFYRSVCIDDSWATVSQETDPLLSSALTNENACLDENLETDSEEEIEGNNATHEKEFHKSSVPFPTVL